MMNKFLRPARAVLAASLFVTAVAAQEPSIGGEVRKIDEIGGKITLKHGPAKSLGMDEGMTMAYRVKDPTMLKQVKVGDHVKFEAENSDGGFVVTKLQKAK
jgi:Cu(I)/Ag(I) efflux system periplasmic protein CusF